MNQNQTQSQPQQAPAQTEQKPISARVTRNGHYDKLQG
jgi:hypothetical protein